MTMKAITSFTGEHRFLSNFWHSPMEINGFEFPTVEHFYQAVKAVDYESFEKIRTSSSPAAAKRKGRKIQIRPDWDEMKIGYMELGVSTKFTNPKLAEKLLATGDAELIEGNTWGDTFWGVSAKTGYGRNELGRILMKIRANTALVQF